MQKPKTLHNRAIQTADTEAFYEENTTEHLKIAKERSCPLHHNNV